MGEFLNITMLLLAVIKGGQKFVQFWPLFQYITKFRFWNGIVNYASGMELPIPIPVNYRIRIEFFKRNIDEIKICMWDSSFDYFLGLLLDLIDLIDYVLIYLLSDTVVPLIPG